MKLLSYKQMMDVLEDLLDRASRGGVRAVVGFDMQSEPAQFMYLFRDGDYKEIQALFDEEGNLKK